MKFIIYNDKKGSLIFTLILCKNNVHIAYYTEPMFAEHDNTTLFNEPSVSI